MGFYLKFLFFTVLFCVAVFLFRYYALLLVFILLIFMPVQDAVSDLVMKQFVSKASNLAVISAVATTACYFVLLRYADLEGLRSMFAFFSNASFAEGSWEYEVGNVENRKPRRATNFLPLTPEMIRVSYVYYTTYICGSFASSIVFSYVISHSSYFLTIVDKIFKSTTVEARLFVCFVFLFAMASLHITYFPSFELSMMPQFINLIVLAFCWPICAFMTLLVAQVVRSIIRN